MRSPKKIPAWVKKDAVADYHSIIGGPITMERVKITSDPFILGGHTACVFIEGKSGCVAVAALTKPKKSLTPVPDPAKP